MLEHAKGGSIRLQLQVLADSSICCRMPKYKIQPLCVSQVASLAQKGPDALEAGPGVLPWLLVYSALSV